MLQRSTHCLLLALLLATTLAADDVLLHNGQSFEGVDTAVDGDWLRVHLGNGSIRLPMALVAEVRDDPDATVTRWLEARAALEAKIDATADDWLDLARWADRRGFAHGVRFAADRAADLEPGRAELRAWMRRLGRTFDPAADAWTDAAPATSTSSAQLPAVAATAHDTTAVLVEALERRDSQIDRALDIIAAQSGQPPPQALVVLPQPTLLAVGVGFFDGTGPGQPAPGTPLYTSPLPTSPLNGLAFRGPFAPTSVSWGDLALRQPGSFIPASAHTRR
jgi:hypothetical protein